MREATRPGRHRSARRADVSTTEPRAGETMVMREVNPRRPPPTGKERRKPLDRKFSTENQKNDNVAPDEQARRKRHRSRDTGEAHGAPPDGRGADNATRPRARRAGPRPHSSVTRGPAASPRTLPSHDEPPAGTRWRRRKHADAHGAEPGDAVVTDTLRHGDGRTESHSGRHSSPFALKRHHYPGGPNPPLPLQAISRSGVTEVDSTQPHQTESTSIRFTLVT